jgi:hypothetical protein
MPPDLAHFETWGFKCGHACACHAITLMAETDLLKVENLVQTTFRLSPAGYWAPLSKSPNLVHANSKSIFIISIKHDLKHAVSAFECEGN